MSSLYYNLKDAEMRSICRNKIESLEHWLRRLVDDTLTPLYGDYFTYVDDKGNRLIRGSLSQQVENRRSSEPTRYPRKIDAVLLEDTVDIICKPELYSQHFRDALINAFPNGRDEARTFLNRLLIPRNNLAHANAISVRQAEQIICYSNDVIESLKKYYFEVGMQQEYNVPTILKLTDSFGNVFTRSQFRGGHDSGITMDFTDKPTLYLRPGDTITLELEVDPSFDLNTYEIAWSYSGTYLSGHKAIIAITNKQVNQRFCIQCRLKTNNEWHRFYDDLDDFMELVYKVLPPLK